MQRHSDVIRLIKDRLDLFVKRLFEVKRINFIEPKPPYFYRYCGALIAEHGERKSEKPSTFKKSVQLVIHMENHRVWGSNPGK